MTGDAIIINIFEGGFMCLSLTGQINVTVRIFFSRLHVAVYVGGDWQAAKP